MPVKYIRQAPHGSNQDGFINGYNDKTREIVQNYDRGQFEDKESRGQKPSSRHVWIPYRFLPQNYRNGEDRKRGTISELGADAGRWVLLSQLSTKEFNALPEYLKHEKGGSAAKMNHDKSRNTSEPINYPPIGHGGPSQGQLQPTPSGQRGTPATATRERSGQQPEKAEAQRIPGAGVPPPGAIQRFFDEENGLARKAHPVIQRAQPQPDIEETITTRTPRHDFLVDRMEQLLGQIKRTNRRATPREMDQIRDIYQSVRHELGNTIPRDLQPKFDRIHRDFDRYADLHNVDRLEDTSRLPLTTAEQLGVPLDQDGNVEMSAYQRQFPNFFNNLGGLRKESEIKKDKATKKEMPLFKKVRSDINQIRWANNQGELGYDFKPGANGATEMRKAQEEDRRYRDSDEYKKIQLPTGAVQETFQEQNPGIKTEYTVKNKAVKNYATGKAESEQSKGTTLLTPQEQQEYASLDNTSEGQRIDQHLSTKEKFLGSKSTIHQIPQYTDEQIKAMQGLLRGGLEQVSQSEQPLYYEDQQKFQATNSMRRILDKLQQGDVPGAMSELRLSGGPANILGALDLKTGGIQNLPQNLGREINNRYGPTLESSIPGIPQYPDPNPQGLAALYNYPSQFLRPQQNRQQAPQPPAQQAQPQQPVQGNPPPFEIRNPLYPVPGPKPQRPELPPKPQGYQQAPVPGPKPTRPNVPAKPQNIPPIPPARNSGYFNQRNELQQQGGNSLQQQGFLYNNQPEQLNIPQSLSPEEKQGIKSRLETLLGASPQNPQGIQRPGPVPPARPQALFDQERALQQNAQGPVDFDTTVSRLNELANIPFTGMEGRQLYPEEQQEFNDLYNQLIQSAQGINDPGRLQGLGSALTKIRDTYNSIPGVQQLPPLNSRDFVRITPINASGGVLSTANNIINQGANATANIGGATQGAQQIGQAFDDFWGRLSNAYQQGGGLGALNFATGQLNQANQGVGNVLGGVNQAIGNIGNIDNITQGNPIVPQGPGGYNYPQPYTAANEINRFYQQTIPTLAERFTYLGGGQRGSAFRGALGQAGRDLGLGLAAQGEQAQNARYQQQLNAQQQGYNQATGLNAIRQEQARYGQQNQQSQQINQHNMGMEKARLGLTPPTTPVIMPGSAGILPGIVNATGQLVNSGVKAGLNYL